MKEENYSEMSPHERKKMREEYIAYQNGKCFYCNHPLNEKPPQKITKKKIDWSLFPKNFLLYPVHLQHNHVTDKTEGAVHAYCNAVMWQYEGK